MPGVSQKPVGRPRAAKKMERLPPFYVSPEVEAAVLSAAERGNKEVSEWGRELLEKFASGRLVEADATPRLPDNAIVLELPPDLHAKITAFAKTKAIKHLPDFLEHLIERALEVKPATFHKFFYDDADSAAEALALDRAKREPKQTKDAREA